MSADADDEFVMRRLRMAWTQEAIVQNLHRDENIDPGVAGTRVHNALVRLRSAGRIRSKTVHEVVK